MILAINVWMDKSYNCRKETKDSLMILEIDVWMDKSYKFNYRKETKDCLLILEREIWMVIGILPVSKSDVVI